MWTTVLLVVHLMIATALVGVVLLQRSEGGALGMGGGGGGGFMTGRGTANLLTRMTAVLAAGFFATSIGLTLLANHGVDGTGTGSIFDRVSVPAPGAPAAPATPAAETPATGGATPAVPAPTPAMAPEAPKAAEPAPAPEAPRGGVLDKLEQGKSNERLPRKK